jgi:hypothetical protein
LELKLYLGIELVRLNRPKNSVDPLSLLNASEVSSCRRVRLKDREREGERVRVRERERESKREKEREREREREREN